MFKNDCHSELDSEFVITIYYIMIKIDKTLNIIVLF